MIFLTGAGGKTGRTLIRTLSKVESVCAFVHREEHVSVAKASGAEKVVVGDMRDENALQKAMQDIRAIYHICPNMDPDEVGIGKLVIDQARANGVEHFVYHSVLHPQIEKMPHHWDKLRVEEMLFESGLPCTILQPAPYMQNLSANWTSIIEDGVLRVPYSLHSKFSFVDLEDVAEAAKIVLSGPGHKNAIYELVGTSPTSYAEVAEIFSKVLKRGVRADREDIGDWASRARGMNEYAIENLVKMFEYYDQWGLAGNLDTLRWLLKWEPASLEEFIDRIAQEYNAVH